MPKGASATRARLLRGLVGCPLRFPYLKLRDHMRLVGHSALGQRVDVRDLGSDRNPGVRLWFLFEMAARLFLHPSLHVPWVRQ